MCVGFCVLVPVLVHVVRVGVGDWEVSERERERERGGERARAWVRG